MKLGYQYIEEDNGRYDIRSVWIVSPWCVRILHHSLVELDIKPMPNINNKMQTFGEIKLDFKAAK